MAAPGLFHHRQRVVPVLYRRAALHSGKLHPCRQKEMLHARVLDHSLKNPDWCWPVRDTTMIIQVATGSIAPILTLYVSRSGG